MDFNVPEHSFGTLDHACTLRVSLWILVLHVVRHSYPFTIVLSLVSFVWRRRKKQTLLIPQEKLCKPKNGVGFVLKCMFFTYKLASWFNVEYAMVSYVKLDSQSSFTNLPTINHWLINNLLTIVLNIYEVHLELSTSLSKLLSVLGMNRPTTTYSWRL